MLRSASLLAVPLALLSCSSEPAVPAPAAPPPAAAPPLASSSSVFVPPEPPSLPASPCGDLLDHNKKLLAGTSPDRGNVPQGEVNFLEACYPTTAGAWGLRLLSWAPEDDSTDPPSLWSGAFEVVHFGKGQEARFSPPQGKDITPAGELLMVRVGMDYHEPRKPVLFDFDGDGEPEFFFSNAIKHHEDAFYVLATLFSWKQDKIAPYPGLPASYDGIEDFDKDGRPDLLYHPYSDGREHACSGFGFRWEGPAFLLHSLRDGTFSRDDKVASDFLKQSCPAPPVVKARKSKETISHADDNPPEVCARLWGASEKEAVATLRRVCSAPKKPEEMCQPPPGVCPDFKEREEAARVKPPMVLKK